MALPIKKKESKPTGAAFSEAVKPVFYDRPAGTNKKLDSLPLWLQDGLKAQGHAIPQLGE